MEQKEDIMSLRSINEGEEWAELRNKERGFGICVRCKENEVRG